MDAVVSDNRFRSKGWRFTNVPPIAYLLIGFVVCVAPHAFRYAIHHPDERYYTNAAIQMVQTGDYLTPRTGEGDLRLKKPILTYWLIAASYQLLGISLLASRLPFVLVGAGVIWLTYRMAWYMWDDRRTGLLAALVVSLQPALIISSPRTIPDIVLTFFLLISTFGFIRLIRESKADWLPITMAFLGNGLAIQSKGLPAAVFGIFACCMLLIYRRQQVFKDWPQYVAGLLMWLTSGLAWFVAMYSLHGSELLAHFFGDQISERVALSVWQVLGDLPQVILFLALCFFPWWGWLREAVVRRFRGANGKSRPIDPGYLLIAIWVGIYLVLAASVSRVNVRYLSTIIPLASIMAAGLMSELAIERWRTWLNRFGWTSVITAIGLTMVATAVCFEFGDVVPLGIGLAIAVGIWAIIALTILLTNRSWQAIGVSATVSALTLVAVSYVTVYSLARQTFSERLLAQIELQAVSKPDLAYATESSFASRFRVVSGGKIHPIRLDTEFRESAATSSDYDLLVLSDDATRQIDPSEFKVFHDFDGYRDLETSDFLWAAIRGNLAEYVDAHREQLNFAIRRSNPRQAKDESHDHLHHR